MATREQVEDLLLVRRGLVHPPPPEAPENKVLEQLAGLELARLGYLPSRTLSEALSRLAPAQLARVLQRTTKTLAAALGADQKHEPMFRKFPKEVPSDTTGLWWSRVLVHVVQQPEQPCVLCGRSGTTHVLKPCRHVACDACFDGSNYAGCPVCHRHVDRDSPFFRPDELPAHEKPAERVRFKLLQLGSDLDENARQFFASLCLRTQALSPADKDALATLAGAYGIRVLDWLPPVVPVKENVAIVFGTLFQRCPPASVLPVARRYLKTATDVLRLVAAYSNADPGLLPQLVFRRVDARDPRHHLRGKLAVMPHALNAGATNVTVPVQVRRFKVAKLGRPLRKALLAILEDFAADSLVEDMLRHRSYWVWLGEFLHPHEYADRFPSVARAFLIVRGKAPDGAPAPEFRTFASKVESALATGDLATATELLAQRPGELGRRLDHALRTAQQHAPSDPAAAAPVVNAFVAAVPRLPNPMLLTLRNHLPTRLRAAPVRLFWPKTQVFLAPSGRDERAVLTRDSVSPAVHAAEAELLARFGGKSRFETALIDRRLRGIAVPFNERTASRSAVSLPRGSRVTIPPGKTVRLFLHWCEPAGGERTDLDLSIGFYDGNWNHVGVCSYYSLKLVDRQGGTIAVSSGDRTSAPAPDGASEFVDLDRERALAAGFRYAVMVVNAYSGLPFSSLERAFAGVMLRDDAHVRHFDPRTVHLKFALAGSNGVFMPMAVDLATDELHWLDAESRGAPEFNNVASSNAAIATIVPAMLSYFASGARPSMYELALMHAAARARRVNLRDGTALLRLERGASETSHEFFRRLLAAGAETNDTTIGSAPGPVFAALVEGDVELPSGSASFVLFPGKATGTLAASDLLA